MLERPSVPRGGIAAVAAALAACLAASVVPSRARADSWTGTDKFLHFGVSAGLAGAGYGLGVGCCDRRPWALLIGGGIGLGAGAAKELADLAGLGEPSGRDFVWDVAGTVAGLALALCIDLAVRGLDSGTWGVSPRASLPVPRAGAGQGPAAAAGAAVRGSPLWTTATVLF